MKLSQKQDQALVAVNQWLKHGTRQVFRLFGYAGTGKTTLANYFAKGIDGDVAFAAFTGKATQVLRSKGIVNASTIHSLIYRPHGEETIIDTETGIKSVIPTFSLNHQSAAAKAKLIIIDECSMVDEALAKDLLSFNTPILVLGDPGQLPPVSNHGFFTKHKPDFLLEDIHRQASDNPIIDISQKVRNGEELQIGSYGEKEQVKIISRNNINSNLILKTDQVLVGTNRTRNIYNKRIRKLKEIESLYPVSGDKLVCLRNNPKKGLLNGSLWHVKSTSNAKNSTISLLISSENESLKKVSAKIKLLRAVFEGYENNIPWNLRRRHDDFDFGYTLTVHKSQGSQWNSVILFDESYIFQEHRQRWLYTGITRASERLIIVK